MPTKRKYRNISGLENPATMDYCPSSGGDGGRGQDVKSEGRGKKLRLCWK